MKPIIRNSRLPGTRSGGTGAPRSFLAGLILGLVLGLVGARALEPPAPEPPREGIHTGRTASGARMRTVRRIVDGDTVELDGRERVRIIGVDTPETGEPFAGDAKAFVERMLRGRPVGIVVCQEEPRDDYGRTLAFVRIGGKDLGKELLRKGLARTLFAGPCARRVARTYRRLERDAFRSGIGIWSLQRPRSVPHDEAFRYIGCLMNVVGRVRSVHMGPKAVHLNFGRDYRKDFTAVIFRKDLPRLLREGLDPVGDYKGKTVEVTGTIRDYNGPEIIIDSADQISLAR